MTRSPVADSGDEGWKGWAQRVSLSSLLSGESANTVPLRPSSKAHAPEGVRRENNERHGFARRRGGEEPCPQQPGPRLFLFPVLDRPFDLATGLAGLDSLAAVVLLFPFRQRQFHLGVAALREIDTQRNEGQALKLSLPHQFVDFLSMEQELSFLYTETDGSPHRIG